MSEWDDFRDMGVSTPTVVEPRAPQEPPAFDDWASHIVDGIETKAPSQIEYEIVEGLQKAHRLGQEARPAPPLDWQRFRDAFRLLYTDIEDFHNIGDMSDSATGLAARRIEQFAELFNEAMRPDPALPSPPAAPK